MAEVPFTKRGGVETLAGPWNKKAVAEFNSRIINVIPRSPARSQRAKKLPQIFQEDDSMRLHEPGFVEISFYFQPTYDASPGTVIEGWSLYKDAFGAYRTLKEHIAEQYLEDGVQHENRLAVVRQANVLIDRLQSGSIPDDEMESLREETIESMAQAKYLTSKIPGRREVGRQLLMATERDKKGRRNQPAARMRVASQRPQIIGDLLLDEHIAIKNLFRAAELDTEFDLEELALKRFAQTAKIVGNMNVGTGAFNQKVLDKFLEGSHRLLSPKTTILLQPYASYAAKLRYALFAKNNTDGLATLLKYSREDAVEFSETSPIFSNLEMDQKKERILELSHMADAYLNILTELRHAPSMPKEKKPVKPNKSDLFWQELEENVPFDVN
ncbi:MAG: hypothetical protein Q7T54_01835 [Candidatus Levybacteria bacterium]|nr:hypothetical protein [Candidatus Levybacteria bacterium]